MNQRKEKQHLDTRWKREK